MTLTALTRSAILPAGHGMARHPLAACACLSIAVLALLTGCSNTGRGPVEGPGHPFVGGPRPSAAPRNGSADPSAALVTDEQLLAPAADPASAPRPAETGAAGLNLVLVTIDTLRIDLGFMGYDCPISPNLDALAARSTAFDRAYSMASYTGKSIGPMMIGKYASECVRDGAHFDAYGPDNTFLAERLRDAGLRTMGVLSHWYFRPKYGLLQGLDEWDLSVVKGEDVTWVATSEGVTDGAIRMLSQPGVGQGRFFLWAHYFDPHQMYLEHAEEPDFGCHKSRTKTLYDGEVWYTDHHLGRLLDFIAAQPWADRTVLVVTADHGEAFNEHGVKGHGVDLWESLVRVPLIVYVPGVAPHRVAVKRSLVDLVPTVLDLLDLPQPPPGELSGRSMAPDILKADASAAEERDVYLDMPAGPQVHEHRAIIHGPTPGLKLMYEGGPVYFLFDLGKDARESRDLAGDRRALAPMMSLLQGKRASLHTVPVGW